MEVLEGAGGCTAKVKPPCLFGARERNSALNVLESNAYLSNVWIFALFLIALLISR